MKNIENLYQVSNYLRILKANMTVSQLHILLYIYLNEGCSPASCADDLGLSRSFLTRQIHDFEVELKVAKRIPNPKNARDRILHLTSRGRKIVYDIEKMLNGDKLI